jgi:hypothetical protein
LVITLLVGVVIGVWAYAEVVHTINYLEMKVDDLTTHVDERTISRFTREDFASWLRVFKASNTGGPLTIPDADDR